MNTSAELLRPLHLSVDVICFNAETQKTQRFAEPNSYTMRKSFLYISILFVIYLGYYYLLRLYFFVITESENAYHQLAEWLPLAYNVSIYQIAMVNLLLALMAEITFVMYLKRSAYKKKGLLRFLIVMDVILIALGLWQVFSVA